MTEKQKIKIELEVENHKDALFLHQEIGKGIYGDKEVRVIQTNQAIIVQSQFKDKKKDQTFDNFIIPWSELSKKLIKALI